MTSLTVNGHALDFRMDPQVPLLWALRDGANLTGSKYGCGVGECGACTVLVDGTAVMSCTLSLAEAEGRSVTTIEGLGKDGLHPVQRAMLDEGAIQCGFCTPGIVMAAAALLASNADPSDDAIKAALTNLCRCGVYPRLVRGVQRAGRIMRGVDGSAVPFAPSPAPG
ncbi:MAG: (2Fe-2S)-binding protein [Novosphingobium sp.]